MGGSTTRQKRKKTVRNVLAKQTEKRLAFQLRRPISQKNLAHEAKKSAACHSISKYKHRLVLILMTKRSLYFRPEQGYSVPKYKNRLVFI